jgi:nicotinamidase-related amidase
MKALLVIDMQEDYVGENRNKKRFPYHPETLIPRINQRIQDFNSEGNLVVYILNRFFYQSKRYTPQLVQGLRIVNDKTFVKNRVSCFTNPELTRFLRENHVTELETVGVDGNYCVAASARAGVKKGFSVLFNQQCVEAAKKDRFGKTITRLKAGKVVVHEPLIAEEFDAG